MTDDMIVLTLPPERDFHRVAHLVLGGLALRLNLTLEALEGVVKHNGPLAGPLPPLVAGHPLAAHGQQISGHLGETAAPERAHHR